MATLAVAVAFGACAKSVLIRPGDGTYANAVARMERTAREVDALSAPPLERATFLQAESLYRYRFEPPRRSPGMYIAQALAVAAELPALQAFSGSLDLNDLRLKMSDGAVHLWESLLLRNPKTPLRPLVLYRLGWAYRSTGVAGLPRSDGNEAFRALLAEGHLWPTRGIVEDALAAPWKSKGTASAYSIVPGLAHFYVGEYRGGVVRLAVAMAAAAAVLWPLAIALRRRHDLSWQHDWPLLLSGSLGFTVLSIDYTNSYEDAMRAVVEFNERQERLFQRTHPEEP